MSFQKDQNSENKKESKIEDIPINTRKKIFFISMLIIIIIIITIWAYSIKHTIKKNSTSLFSNHINSIQQDMSILLNDTANKIEIIKNKINVLPSSTTTVATSTPKTILTKEKINIIKEKLYKSDGINKFY